MNKDKMVFLIMLTIPSQKMMKNDRRIMDFCSILRYNACNKAEEESASWQRI